MRKSTSLSGSRSVRPAILVVSLVTIAAIGVLQGLPSTAASADDFTPLAEQGLRLGTTPTSDETVRVRVSDVYGKLPLYFEANRGQTDPEVKFLSRSAKHTLFLTSREAVLVFMSPANHGKDVAQPLKARIEEPGKVTGTALRMAFLGANPDARVAGRDELPGQANYFIGNDPANWRTNVPTFARVHYQNLYPSIDLVYYGNQLQLEYDFVVRPGADPSRIVLGFKGADRLEVDAQGDLVLHTAAGVILQRKPLIYQDVDGVREEILGGYVLKGPHQVGFQVAAYDKSRPLVIDPVLFYSTYLGGSGDEGCAGCNIGVAVDAAGNAYVTGITDSSNFPTTTGAFQTTRSGFSGDAFVTKLNPTGSALVYSTYLGGSRPDAGFSIAVDAFGSAHVTGFTTSTNFPTTPGAAQTTINGIEVAFVTKLDPTGSGLVYSTYLGANVTIGMAIAVDSGGNAYVTGELNQSSSFAFQSIGSPCSFSPFAADAFVAKVNLTGTALVYSTRLCGSGNDAGFGIAVDPLGNAYVTGLTSSSDFPTTPGAFQTTFGGGGSGFGFGPLDAFVTKVNPFGTAAVYSTFLGGSGDDGAHSIALDAAGDVYVTGFTNSTNFPTTSGAFQTALGGGLDAFMTKLNPIGTALVYSTYLGGGGDDRGQSTAVDALSNAYVTGATNSADFPIANAVQGFIGGGADAFVTKVNPSGTGLGYSTYLGGSGDDRGLGIALDAFANPNVYIAGDTHSLNFPTTPGAFQTTYGGGSSDAFVAKITDVVVEPPPTEGKVTGGGSFDVAGGQGTFGFIVQRKETGGPVKGQVQYVNHASGDKVQSLAFDSLVITGNLATFGGACTMNKVTPCTFRVDVTDNGEPGTTDSFVISVTPGSTEGGMLRSGNIQIHK